MDFYIIEHPSRGTFMEWRFDYDKNAYSKPRFSWKGLRTDENVKRYSTSEAAKIDLVKLPPKCYILHVNFVRGKSLTIRDLDGNKR